MTAPVYRRTVPAMGALVTIDVVGHFAAPAQHASLGSSHVEAAVERACDWFAEIEACCSRFDPRSELSRLSATLGVAVPVSDILYRAVEFALAVAEETAGAFDPTIGAAMETRSFNRNYRSGQIVRHAPVATTLRRGDRATYRDVRLDPQRKTITLLRPLLLDLGAVAKGLAIDMAAHELRPFANFAINAGGDVYVAGHNRRGAPWNVGISHPRVPGELIDSLSVSDCAVCTSGDYERRCPDASSDASPDASNVSTGAASAPSEAPVAEPGGHHILDPRCGRSPRAAASATVIAPSAMLADALATAAFVLGPADGIALLERLGVCGLIISPALARHVTNLTAGPPPRTRTILTRAASTARTQGKRSDLEPNSATILPDAQRPDADCADGASSSGRAI
jgi:FAD:protein FMN transferase